MPTARTSAKAPPDFTGAALMSVERAREIVLAATTPLPVETAALGDAFGRVLARDVTAVSDVPPFHNSAMDGFAVNAGAQGRTLTIVGEARAGAPAGVTLEPGQAIRISTGARLPDGADAVAPIERVHETEATVTLLDGTAPGQNVRRAGEDMRAGHVVLSAGERLGAAQLAVAATAGRAELDCARRPRLALVATGDELVDPGEPLGPGQIYDSNAVALTALARLGGAVVGASARVGDDAQATEAALEAALVGADVVVISGGVSVGPHDHVKPALHRLGAEQRFWRVALRPGKPTWFGTRERTLIFGLPGNPVSAFVTFVLFVRPALAALQGADPLATRNSALLTAAVPRNPGRDEAVRVSLEHADGTLRARPTGPQGSHVVTSLLGADALAIVPAGDGEVAAGTPVPVELLEAGVASAR
jgi:molybdopterin molybdotransferase